MIYLLNLLCIFFYGAILSALGKKGVKVFLLIATIHIALFHALRNPYLYPDNLGYAEAYNEIINYDFEKLFFTLNDYSFWEPGYVYYNYLLTRISDNPEYLFMTTSLFMVIGYMITIYKNSFIPLISILLYLLYPLMFGQSLYVLRQHIATIFIFGALYSVTNFKKSIIYAVTAILFHYSAIIFLPFYLFYIKKLIRLKFPFLFLITVSFVIFSRLIIPIIISQFPRFTDYNEYENNFAPFILISSLLFMHFLNGSFHKVKTQNDEITLSFLFYGTLICFIMLGMPGGGRMTNYFIYLIPIAYPLLFKYNNSRINLFVKFAYSLCFWGVVLYMAISANIIQYDYSFYWK